LAKKTSTQKQADMLKKTYHGKIISQTTQTYYFKQLLSYHEPFRKFLRISNALKQQRSSHQIKVSAMIFKRTSQLSNNTYSWSTLFIEVIKIIHKHNGRLCYTTFFSTFSQISNALSTVLTFFQIRFQRLAEV